MASPPDSQCDTCDTQEPQTKKEEAEQILRQAQAARELVEKLEQSYEAEKPGLKRKGRAAWMGVPRPTLANQRAQRFRQVRRELLLSQLRSDSEGSADFAVNLSPSSSEGEQPCYERFEPSSTYLCDGECQDSDGLERRIQDEVIDELCWASADWRQAQEGTTFEDGCSLQEARSFCRMCLRRADAARLEQARLLGEPELPEEEESSSELAARISSHEEARSFALMCLRAIEDYETENKAIHEAKVRCLM
ncbi:unnamed protein product [Effrenium voratum]|uniref:Uncharacterized protein n=1 Tax=Effrenium voratum TaxID=2562239 RepID=A0AA36JM46_9DINO|nr:unnamed protein product [Effrenium voratum]CAJ1407581.1 unnamed protein product [Effrenium voratum]